MPATLKLTRKPVLLELRGGRFDAILDGKSGGSIGAHDTIETPIEPGRHTLQVRRGRYSSRAQTFDAAEDEIVAFWCRGTRFWPVWLVSFVVPSLAFPLRHE
jgi:hypothetical protein